ncbi:unnamed protein product [Chrysoparadoxa australica]
MPQRHSLLKSFGKLLRRASGSLASPSPGPVGDHAGPEHRDAASSPAELQAIPDLQVRQRRPSPGNAFTLHKALVLHTLLTGLISICSAWHIASNLIAHQVGLCEEQGRRATMEDMSIVETDLGVEAFKDFEHLSPQSFLAVLDGHGGSDVSCWLQTHLLVELKAQLQLGAAAIIEAEAGEERNLAVTEAIAAAFAKADDALMTDCSNAYAGSCATTVLLMGNMAYLANVGDSRTLLCRQGKVHLATLDHKPTRKDEMRRIMTAGGIVLSRRVMGELAVSRAFGDHHLKTCTGKGGDKVSNGKRVHDVTGGFDLGPDIGKAPDPSSDGEEEGWTDPLVISVPEVLSTALTVEDEFLVLACDGLFDVLANEEVVRIARVALKRGRSCNEVSKALVTIALEEGTNDNVSVIVASLGTMGSGQ